MQNTSIDPSVLSKAQTWLGKAFDPETRAEVQRLINEDPLALTDAFYKDLEFGTGGLRGIMGVGVNKMNVYTVGMATQGLCNYLKNVYRQDTGALVTSTASSSGSVALTINSLPVTGNYTVYVEPSNGSTVTTTVTLAP